MAKKIVYERMEFGLDKDVFKGPFTCHSKKTRLVEKERTLGNHTFFYKVWECSVCKKEFLDSDQSKNMENIWTLELLLAGKTVSMKRNLNYDGKMFFLRFPKELGKNFKKGQQAEIKIINNKKFLIEIK